MTDAARELAIDPRASTVDDLTAHIDTIVAFLTTSDLTQAPATEHWSARPNTTAWSPPR